MLTITFVVTLLAIPLSSSSLKAAITRPFYTPPSAAKAMGSIVVITVKYGYRHSIPLR
ncbi:hypothetical protein HK100_005785, partial [Physocladia obscura]